MKKILKAIMPGPIVRMIGGVLVRRRARHLAGLTVADAFDEIYRKQMWRQGASLSGAGSEGKWAEDYTDFVIGYMKMHNCRVVLDMGCGDFAIGQKIAPHAERYMACDISQTIIDINCENYAGKSENVTFAVKNLIEDELPSCDLLLVRQVFQHLSNAQIESALRNIEKARPRHVLIAEHTYRYDLMKEANVDLVSHSIQTRVGATSGVDIGVPPFSRRRRILAVFEPGPENLAEPNTVLAIYELDFAIT